MMKRCFRIVKYLDARTAAIELDASRPDTLTGASSQAASGHSRPERPC